MGKNPTKKQSSKTEYIDPPMVFNPALMQFVPDLSKIKPDEKVKKKN